MQVFGGAYPNDDPALKPRANFDHIFAAMQTVRPASEPPTLGFRLCGRNESYFGSLG